MPAWTELGRDEGRGHAIRILTELIEVRLGGDPVGARLLVDGAACDHPDETIAQALAIAESLLFRLAELTGKSESQVLTNLLADVAGADEPTTELAAVPLITAAKRRPRRARSA
ncbi:MAG: hypothetical protein JWO37_3165 [Acidimicrobiales bacterium]|jgi:hypothetical protein|nr:hypothetical protein [Acidimicrobiales bacterium]